MSLRARLLVGLAAVALVLVAAAVAVARTTQTYLSDQVDDQLASIAGRFPGRPPTFPPEQSFAPYLGQAGSVPEDRPRQLSPLYVGFLDADGNLRTIFAPTLADDAAVPRLDTDQVVAAAASGQPFTTGSTGDVPYRVRATMSDAMGGIEVLALPLEDTDAATSRLIAVEAVATLAVLGVLGVVAWWVIGLGLRPVKQMARTAGAIADGDLSSRVPEGDPRTEVGELGSALNLMLGRIEHAFAEQARADERLRRFIADASHELRTPITTIQGYADLYRHGGLRNEGELADAMRRTEQEAARMGALVEEMLELARLDEGRPLRCDPVDLSVLGRDAAADARATDPLRNVTVTAKDAVVAIGDDDRLRQVLANLVANALVHTPVGTPVRIATYLDGADAVLEVHDAGPGMPDAVAGHAFERFYRGDPSRNRSRGGSGLGLAIVEAIITAHGGHVDLRSTPGEGTTVRIALPAAGPGIVARPHADRTVAPLVVAR